MNKILTHVHYKGLQFLMIGIFLLFLSHNTLFAQTYAEGTVIKAQGSDKMYHVLSGYRWLIPNEQALAELGKTTQNIQNITEAQLNNIALPPNGSTFWVSQGFRYMIKDGVRYAFASNSQSRQYQKDNPTTKDFQLPKPLLNGFEDYFADGSIIKIEGDSTIYQLWSNFKWAIKDKKTFEALHLDSTKVKTISVDIANKCLLNPTNGTVVQYENNDYYGYISGGLIWNISSSTAKTCASYFSKKYYSNNNSSGYQEDISLKQRVPIKLPKPILEGYAKPQDGTLVAVFKSKGITDLDVPPLSITSYQYIKLGVFWQTSPNNFATLNCSADKAVSLPEPVFNNQPRPLDGTLIQKEGSADTVWYITSRIGNQNNTENVAIPISNKVFPRFGISKDRLFKLPAPLFNIMKNRYDMYLKSNTFCIREDNDTRFFWYKVDSTYYPFNNVAPLGITPFNISLPKIMVDELPKPKEGVTIDGGNYTYGALMLEGGTPFSLVSPYQTLKMYMDILGIGSNPIKKVASREWLDALYLPRSIGPFMAQAGSDSIFLVVENTGAWGYFPNQKNTRYIPPSLYNTLGVQPNNIKKYPRAVIDIGRPFERTIVQAPNESSAYFIKDGIRFVASNKYIINYMPKALIESVPFAPDGTIVKYKYNTSDNFFYYGIWKGGYMWAVPDSIQLNLSVNKPVIGYFPFPKPAEGTLFKEINNPAVYIIKNGYRWWIPNETVFSQLGGRWDKVITLPNSAISGLTSNDYVNNTIPKVPNYTIVQDEANENNSFYILEGIAWRIPNKAALEKIKENWMPLIKIPSGLIEGLPKPQNDIVIKAKNSGKSAYIAGGNAWLINEAQKATIYTQLGLNNKTTVFLDDDVFESMARPVDDRFIKKDNDPSVWYIKSGYRWAIKNDATTLAKFGKTTADIISLRSEFVDIIPTVPNDTYLQIENNTEVWFIKDNKKFYVPDITQVDMQNRQIVSIPQSLFNELAIHPDSDRPYIGEEPYAAQVAGDPAVYEIKRGFKWHIPEYGTLQFLGYEGNIKAITAAQRDAFPVYPVDGTCIKASTKSTLYLMINGVRWRIPHDTVVTRLGIDRTKIVTYSEDILNKLPIHPKSGSLDVELLAITDVIITEEPGLIPAGYIAVAENVMTGPNSAASPVNLTRKIGGYNSYIYVKYEKLKISDFDRRVLTNIEAVDFGKDWSKPAAWAAWEFPKTYSYNGRIPQGALTARTQNDCNRIGLLVQYRTVKEVVSSDNKIVRNVAIHVKDHAEVVLKDLNNAWSETFNWLVNAASSVGDLFTNDNSIKLASPMAEGGQMATSWKRDGTNIQGGCVNAMEYNLYLREAQLVEPTYTASKKAALMKKYAPYVYLAIGEEYNPGSVNMTFQNTNDVVINGNHWLTTKEPMTDPQQKMPFFNGDIPNAKVYTYWVEKAHGVEVTYFFYYPYNYGKYIPEPFVGKVMGNHISDWEHTTIRFMWVKGTEWELVPYEVYLAAHDHGSVLPWNKVKKFNGIQPIVYSAKGSHGMYFTPERFIYKTAADFVADIAAKKDTDASSKGISGAAAGFGTNAGIATAAYVGFGVAPIGAMAVASVPFLERSDINPFKDDCSQGVPFDAAIRLEIYDYKTKKNIANGQPWPLWMNSDHSQKGAIWRWGNAKLGIEKMGENEFNDGPTGPTDKDAVWNYTTIEK